MITFTPSSKALALTVAQAQQDVEAWYSLRGLGNGTKYAEWGGAHYQQMSRDRQATIAFLASSDERLRLTAISLVADYWPANEDFAADALRLAFEDVDPAIRGAALVSLSRLRAYVVDPTGVLTNLVRVLFPPTGQEVVANAKRFMHEMRQSANDAINRLAAKLAGASVNSMFESRSMAESYLGHSDPRLRLAALHILNSRWERDEEFARTCEKLVFEDSDIEVRSVAVAYLSGCYMNTDDRRVGRELAQIVSDDAMPDMLRVNAYRGLFVVRGIPFEAYREVASQQFRFPDDVDWDFVHSWR